MELSTLTRAEGLGPWRLKREKLNDKCLLDHLFNRMDGMYPGKWKQNFTGVQSIDNWKDECERVFEEEGITPAHIAIGLRACRKLFKDWPPSVPQFVDACLPPVDVVGAYHEAVAGMEARGKGEVGTWTHPAIYWAASKLARDLMVMPSGQIKERWSATLKAQLARGTWEPIPEARAQLPAPGESMLSAEDAAAMLAQLGAATIMGKPAGFDHLRWARRIMERHEAGEKLSMIQLKEARAALGQTPPAEGPP